MKFHLNNFKVIGVTTLVLFLLVSLSSSAGTNPQGAEKDIPALLQQLGEEQGQLNSLHIQRELSLRRQIKILMGSQGKWLTRDDSGKVSRDMLLKRLEELRQIGSRNFLHKYRQHFSREELLSLNRTAASFDSQIARQRHKVGALQAQIGEVDYSTLPAPPAQGENPSGTGSISGRVTNDYDGIGIRYANIYVYNLTGSQVASAQTARDGSYTVYGISPGNYKVQATEYWEFIAEYYDDVRDWGLATPVTVVADTDTPNIDFGLSTGGFIRGTIINEGGMGIASCNLTVYDYNTGWSISIGDSSTDLNGVYVLCGIPTGTYIVQAYSARVGYISEYYDDAPDYASATPVDVIEGSTTDNIDFILQWGGSITGRVTSNMVSSPHEGLYDVDLDVYDAVTSTYIVWGDTHANGEYVIGGLPTGSYVVHADGGYIGYQSEYYDDVRQWSEATPVAVTIGLTTSGIDFSLEPAGFISGKVLDSGFNAIASMRVYVYDILGQSYGYEYTDSQGKYVSDPLPEGWYKVRARPSSTYMGEYFNDETDFFLAETVKVVRGQTTKYKGFVLSDIPGTDPQEPNDDFASASPINIGDKKTGLITPSGDVDFFVFTGTAGQTIVADIDAEDLYSPLDSYLVLYDSSHTELTNNNYWTTSYWYSDDSRIIYTLPADDTYYLRVEDLGGGGGANYYYHLTLKESYQQVIVAAHGEGGVSQVVAWHVSTDTKIFDEQVFGSGNSSGEVHVAAGDADGDGLAEIACGNGVNGWSGFSLWKLEGKIMQDRVFDGKNSKGEVHVAVGNFSSGRPDEGVIAHGLDGKSRVVAGSANGVILFDNQVFGAGNVRGEVNVASGDVDGDGFDEIICGHGDGGNSQVRVFELNGTQIFSKKVFWGGNPSGEVHLASGDVDGDGVDEIICGHGYGGNSQVKVFELDGTLIFNQNVFGSGNSNGEVHLASGDVDGDGVDEIICGHGYGGNSRVSVFELNGTMIFNKKFFGAGNTNGEVHVAGW